MKLKFACSIVLTSGIFVAACGGGGGGSTGDALKKTTEATEAKINSPTGTFDQGQAAAVGAAAATASSGGIGGLGSALAGGATGSASSGLESQAISGALGSVDALAYPQSSSSSNSFICPEATKALGGGADGSGECACGGGGKVLYESKNVSAFAGFKIGKDTNWASLPNATLVLAFQGCKIAQGGANISYDGALAMQSAPNKLTVGMDLTFEASASGQSFKSSVSFGYGYLNGDIWALVELPKGNVIAVATGKYDPATKSGEIKVKDKNGVTICTLENGVKKECHAG